MRDTLLQTPQKDLSLPNRKSKSIPDHSKKALKNAKKNLNSEFAAVVEGAALPESSKESVDFSLIPEAVDDFQFSESTESFVFPLHPAEASPSPENSFLSDLTSVSSGIPSEIYTTNTASTYQCQNAEEKTSDEAEIAIKHLRQARIQVMNSADVDLQSKKLLDAIIDIVTQDICRAPTGEKNCSHTLVLNMRLLLLVSLTFLLVIIAVFFGSLHNSSRTQPFMGSLPT